VAIFHTTMHMFGNMYVRLDGDVAHADSYAMLIHRRDDDDGVTHEFDVPAARYVETLSRRDDRWLITKRGDEARWRTTPLPLARAAAPAVRWLVDRAVIRDVVLGRARATDERGDTSHFAGTQSIDVGGDEATARTYWLVASGIDAETDARVVVHEHT